MDFTLDRHTHLAALITRSAGGDRVAFREMHGLTHDYLYHTALRLLHLPSLAEDALQEAYLSIWLHARSFRPGQGSPMTWLIAIVRNRALSILRSNKNAMNTVTLDDEPALLAEMESGDELDPGAQVYAVHARERLEQALARLEPAQRQSITLAFGQELTHVEIAQHLGVPLGTAKSWVRRGLERLRLCLEEPTGAGAPTRPGGRLAARAGAATKATSARSADVVRLRRQRSVIRLDDGRGAFA